MASIEAIVRLVILVVWSLPSSFRTRLSVPAAALSFVASLLICFVSYVEGRKSIRPSPILNFYLFGSCLFGIVQLRTLWLASTYKNVQHIAISSSVSLVLQILLLILEALPKQRREFHVSPEDLAGVYTLRTFWWINRVLRLGRTKQLEHIDLYPIDSGLKTSTYSSQLLDSWGKGGRSWHCLVDFTEIGQSTGIKSIR